MIDRQLVAATISPLAFAPDELAAFVAAIDRQPPQAIRLRSGVLAERLPFSTMAVPWHAQGRMIQGNVRPGATLAFAAGEYYIQDAASLLPIALLNAQPGETICDLCAAPGGKATAILESLGDRGWLLANESVQSRCGVLEFNLARHGSTRYLVCSRDPEELAKRLPGRFDAVLVDAPCSGQSLVGRGKQTASAFSANTVEHCAARQSRILNAAARLVRVGGRLVYATCTFAYAENEAQVVSFLEAHPGWKLDPGNPPWLAAMGATLGDVGLRLWPHQHNCSGAFAACVRREADDDDDPPEASHDRDRESRLIESSLPPQFCEWGGLSEVAVYRNKLQCFAWPRDVPNEWLAYSAAGPEVTFCKGSTWFPAYALAMRRDAGWTVTQQVELDDPQAMQFMRGQVVSGSLRGWGVATWHDRPLGWLKGDGRQMKNHLPKAGRFS